MHRPNFFIVGQPKSGTTALHSFLIQHPDVFMSLPKEPNFFCKDFHDLSDAFHGRKSSSQYFEFRDLEKYLSLYDHTGNQSIIGEASINYLYSQTAASEIFQFNPQAKILIMLREPVSFLQALHSQYVNEAAEDITDFSGALEAETERTRGKNIPRYVRCPSYVLYSKRIAYAEQIERFLKFFPTSQVKIILFEDFKNDNEGVYRDILKFLDISDSFIPNFTVVHDSKVPKSRHLNTFFRLPYLKVVGKKILSPRVYDAVQLRVQKMLMKREKRTVLDKDVADALRRRFYPEVEKLSLLLKRPLLVEWAYKKNE